MKHPRRAFGVCAGLLLLGGLGSGLTAAAMVGAATPTPPLANASLSTVQGSAVSKEAAAMAAPAAGVGQTISAESVAQILSAEKAGQIIDVPTDPGVTYQVDSKTVLANGHLELTTKRVGPSGTSYARREIDCASGAVRYLGSGDSLAEANENGLQARMSRPVPESITGVITREACAAP